MSNMDSPIEFPDQLAEILGAAVELDASDLHVASNEPVYVRVAGQLMPLNNLADLDQDGRVDLLVDSFGNDDEILILPGNGDGTFSVPVAYDVASFNVDFGLLDFDMDGNLDLLFTRNVGLLEETAMLPGQAGQFFNAASEIVLGSGVANLELLRAGDVNGDGLLDLTGFDSVLLGASASSLDPPLAFLDTGFAFSDQNGDGALDLVELSSSDDAIAVSLNRQ